MFLVQLVSQRPLIFWGTVWAIALMLISGSIATLLDPSASQRVSLHELFPPPQPIAAPSPVASDAAPPTSPNGASAISLSSPVPSPAAPTAIVAEQPTLPYRSLAAIVLGCGLGSILISQLMNRSPQPQRLRSAAPAAQRPPTAKTSVRSTPPQPLPPSPQSAFAPAVYQMPPALTTARSKPRSTTAQQPAPPAVTVLPPEASHPLDWDKNSLVNAMDIRKRRSLSSWM